MATAIPAARTCCVWWKPPLREYAARAGTLRATLLQIYATARAQGHDGIDYSLASREIIADAIEIHGMATPFDATVYIASCDKGLPANLMASGRLNTPGIFVPGGVMDAGPDLLTLERIGTYGAQYERGEITAEQFRFYKTHACPSCGACSFMGTACTMQMVDRGPGACASGQRACSGRKPAAGGLCAARGRTSGSAGARGQSAREIS